MRKDYAERYGEATDILDCEYRAARLARSEINMAYRTAEQKRWEQFDFVVGYEIKTTDSDKHVEDICDELAGQYPKDFEFTGWHPNCMCYTVPILKTEDEFWDYDQDNPTPSENEVTDVPENFKEWVRDNSNRINDAFIRGKLPYFIENNERYVQESIKHVKDASSVKGIKTPQQIADKRHAKRTQTDIDDIQRRWNDKRVNDLYNLSDRIGSYRNEYLRDAFSLLEDDRALDDFGSFNKHYDELKARINKQIEEETRFAKDFLSNPINRQNLEEIATHLGISQGKLMTFFEADQLRSNPNYRANEIYRINCQTCVVADELRRRGLNIQALGNTKGSWLERLSRNTNQIWLDENGDIPEKLIIGAKAKTKTNPFTGKTYISSWEKTVSNRKQLIKELEESITEDGRYHINWSWNGQGKYIKGHIITLERINGELRYFDPQNGKVIDNFYNYINDIRLNRGISILRVDNLRLNPDWVEQIIAKAGTKSVSGISSISGVIGKFDDNIKELRNTALNSGNFTLSSHHIQTQGPVTTELNNSKKTLRRLIEHCVNLEEIKAAEFIWNNPSKLEFKRISPLGEGKDMTSEKAKRNINNKRKRGIEEYIQYEFSYNGSDWIVKTERHKSGFEQFYHIRKK